MVLTGKRTRTIPGPAQCPTSQVQRRHCVRGQQDHARLRYVDPCVPRRRRSQALQADILDLSVRPAAKAPSESLDLEGQRIKLDLEEAAQSPFPEGPNEDLDVPLNQDLHDHSMAIQTMSLDISRRTRNRKD